jgi:hypothetical protein
MGAAADHIAAWEAAHLIDAETAGRLRAAEGAAAPRGAAQGTEPGSPSVRSEADDSTGVEPMRSVGGLAAVFGPGVSVGEMFGYVGGAFLLGAWIAFVNRIGGAGASGDVTMALGAGVGAIVLAALGWWLRSGNARRRRAAGIAFVIATAQTAWASWSFAATLAVHDGQWRAVIAATAALVVAVVGRRVLPSVVTQLGVLGSLTALAAVLLALFRDILVPANPGEFASVRVGGPDPIILLALEAAWWLGLAVVVGFIGLREARSDGDPAALRRAAASRLWAGMVAVIGVAIAVTRRDVQVNGDYDRVLAPWLGDIAIVVVSAVLVERAFRRDASTFVYPAALGVIVAATDFNFSYLSNSTEIGLLAEGLILVGAGIAADRLRRRIGRRGDQQTEEPGPGAAEPLPAGPR